jgi:hypothetical protein
MIKKAIIHSKYSKILKIRIKKVKKNAEKIEEEKRFRKLMKKTYEQASNMAYFRYY